MLFDNTSAIWDTLILLMYKICQYRFLNAIPSLHLICYYVNLSIIGRKVLHLSKNKLYDSHI
ncbi:hypothetical protein SAMN05443667_11438 [Flavobacterium gillisiae]|uniref:Uncharacterized protein n=1 Tax=Flavobacterium gillisiae TaxID=150146 RepID=A0A1H4FMX8_9FLAO|nr:hypothetical protein SAMN05443667_11438 [Flavobacterium gillisiae]